MHFHYKKKIILNFISTSAIHKSLESIFVFFCNFTNRLWVLKLRLGYSPNPAECKQRKSSVFRTGDVFVLCCYLSLLRTYQRFVWIAGNNFVSHIKCTLESIFQRSAVALWVDEGRSFTFLNYISTSDRTSSHYISTPIVDSHQ